MCVCVEGGWSWVGISSVYTHAHDQNQQWTHWRQCSIIEQATE